MKLFKELSSLGLHSGAAESGCGKPQQYSPIWDKLYQLVRKTWGKGGASQEPSSNSLWGTFKHV